MRILLGHAGGSGEKRMCHTALKFVAQFCQDMESRRDDAERVVFIVMPLAFPFLVHPSAQERL